MHDPRHVRVGKFDPAAHLKFGSPSGVDFFGVLQTHATDLSSGLVGMGSPYGNGSGTPAVSATARYSSEKSLFTSPDKQSVMSPVSFGYLFVSLRKLKF